MPIINITLSTTPDAARSSRIASAASALTARHLKKDPSVTAVALQHIAPEHWFAGGPSLAAQGLHSFWLDIKIVDGTNTKAELSDYLEAIFAMMRDELGPLHPESYILVDEVPASAYGFGGKTQEYRFISNRLKVA